MKSLRALILQHSSATPAGSCLEYLESRGHDYHVLQLHAREPLPDLNTFDLFISLGGPMNVDDVADFPWLAAEKAYLRDAIHAGKLCLGLCLGAQLIAQVLGAKVEKNTDWEVGWQEVVLLGDEKSELGDRLTVFQWHQDRFDLPEQAISLATNAITKHQAFSYKQNVLAFQFHPESTAAWIKACCSEKAAPAPGPFVQTPAEILARLQFIEPMRNWFFKRLDLFVSRLLDASDRDSKSK